MNYFKFKEFFRQGGLTLMSQAKLIQVCEKIKDFHLPELNKARESLGEMIFITSSFRPKWWEKLRGRSARSEHCFVGKGAVDITTRAAFIRLRKILIQETKYTRVVWYPKEKFFHCDFKAPKKGKRCYYEKNYDTGNWTAASVIE